MKFTLAQINPTIGDIQGNLNKIRQVVSQAPQDTDLIIFPEMALTGYPAQDLLEKPWFRKQIDSAQQELAQLSLTYSHYGLLVGTPLPYTTNIGRGLYNAARLFHQGNCVFEQYKQFLPTYDVFDDARYFDSAVYQDIFTFKGELLGITICEDIWNNDHFWPNPLYAFDPVDSLIKQGATLLINLAASPFEVNKPSTRHQLVTQHVKIHKVPFILVNQVGGNDELIFDGHSFAVNAQGQLLIELKGFDQDIASFDLQQHAQTQWTYPAPIADIEQALVLGIKDYFAKCKMRQAILGLSGGIDSAVVAALACQALESNNVLGIAMPSRYSSQGSIDHSLELARNLGMKCKIIPIDPIVQNYETIFETAFPGQAKDTTEENIQARIRGNILMAFSNKEGHLLLTTGNKSEVAVGYCTLYGDMCGGLAVISDVPKTMVYDLAEQINSSQEFIPQNISTKAPSAELRPNQKDEDSLPPYSVLDAILEAYLAQHKSYQEIVNMGYEPSTVLWVLQTVNRNEYKRRQMPPGLKITSKAFGSGRRFPIASQYSMEESFNQ